MDDGTPPLLERVSGALSADIDPEHLESYDFAEGIMPAFPLLHSLFYGSDLDTCFKMMVLFEVSRMTGRFSIERVRSYTPFLDRARVDGIVRSLKEGGWLELRASDNTYTLSTLGLHLIALLHAADLKGLSPTNVLSRAAQNAQFRTTLDGASGVTTYLLDQLLVVLEKQIEEARAILQHGRPYRMIAWSRRKHHHQMETIREVLGTIEAHTDESSHHFAKVVRLHDAMQEIISLHTGINTRLRDWNLERLYASDAGYSIAQLCESVLGMEESTQLERLVTDGTIQAPTPAPSLTTDEIRVRFQGARRKLKSQREQFEYSPPAPPLTGQWRVAEVDPTAILVARWTELLADRGPGDPPLELEEWIERQSFAGTVYELTLLCRLAHRDRRIPLADGRQVELIVYDDLARQVTPEQLLGALETAGVLRRLDTGLFTRVTLSVIESPSLVVSHG